MNKFKAALGATGVIIGLFLLCVVMALFFWWVFGLFVIFGVGFMWWSFYDAFKR
jgi:hypothetical protein